MTAREDRISFEIPVIRAKQPIGEFFIGVVDSKRLVEITDFDVRRLIKEREFEKYLGIQRPLDMKRVKEIGEYVNTVDACFPTAVILSVRGECAVYHEHKQTLELSNHLDDEDPNRTVLYRQIAKVIDGQHRIKGLEYFHGRVFQVNVCIFVDIDVAEEGYIFSTVNLAQTKVNKSLAYDLYDLAKARSPQKFCHNAAVALDQSEKSAFYKKIKRLGVATEGRFNETITQAQFVESLMPYISKEPMKDRDIYLRGDTPSKASNEELKTVVFRNMFIDGRDLEIVDILWNYFDAVRERWPTAWNATERGLMLNKTNGFRALMRFLRPAYLAKAKPGTVVNRNAFREIFDRVRLQDRDFNIDTFVPGSGGESTLLKTLKEQTGVQ